MIDKREHILESSEALFAEHGFEGTSIRKLAKKAGVNIAMISYYFGSKEKLFEALVEHRAGYLREKLATIISQNLSPLKKIENMVDNYVDRITSQQAFHRMIHRELSLQQRGKLNRVISDVLMKNQEMVKQIITEGQKEGAFRKVDIEMTIATMIGLITQYTQSSFLMNRMMQTEQNNAASDEIIKERLKKHLKDMLAHHLLKTK